MARTIEFGDRAGRALRKPNPSVQEGLLRHPRERIATGDDPRRFGKALLGNPDGPWRYRVGDHRLICRIQDDLLIVLVVGLGHRKGI